MAWTCSATSNAGLVDNLVRNSIILTEPIREAFLAVDRRWFVPRQLEAHCYEDRPLPIGYGVTISAPHMHAAMAELMLKSMLEGGAVPYSRLVASGGPAAVSDPAARAAAFAPLKGKRVLDVGSGSGFLTAVMAHVVGPTGVVHGIEHVPELVASSTRAISENCASFVPSGNSSGPHFTIAVGDGRVDAQFPPNFLQQYYAIHVGAAAPRRAPQSLLDRIAPSGCLVIPIDDGLHVIRRSADGATLTDSIEMGVRFVPLTDLNSQLLNERR